jgi:hypothetical protein
MKNDPKTWLATPAQARQGQVRRRLLQHGLAALAAPAAGAMMPRALAQTTPAQSTPAQSAPAEPVPVLGTPGKDSGWIPTPAGMVEAMLEMAGVTREDTVVDLGSGDGRIPILAAKMFGARGLGIEYNGDLVTYSKGVARREGLADRVEFIQGDIFATDFTHATVVTLFMPPAFNLRVRPQLLAMKPGTRVVSFNFDMAEWLPDQTVYVDSQRGMLWRIPAQVAGEWRFTPGGGTPQVLRLTQRFQQVRGQLDIGNETLALWDLRFEVDRLRFSVLHQGRRLDYEARVTGRRLEGSLQAGGQAAQAWSATLGA